jgi:hypothetical protein
LPANLLFHTCPLMRNFAYVIKWKLQTTAFDLVVILKPLNRNFLGRTQ